MPEFAYQDPLPLGTDETTYRHLTPEYVSTATFEGQEILKVAPEALTALAREAFRDVSFLYRPRHLAKVAAILMIGQRPGRCSGLLRNTAVASGFPLDVPGYRHSHRRRQEGPARLDRGPGRGSCRGDRRAT